MSLPDYKKSYTVLGVFQDDHWDTIRNAYKRLIRKWHPDRFQQEDQREFAENKCKEINLCFRLLDDYYQQHGSLPQVEPVASETAASTADSGRPVKKHETTTGHAEPVDQTPAWNNPDLARNHRRGFRTTVVVIAVIATGYSILDTFLTETPDSSQSEEYMDVISANSPGSDYLADNHNLALDSTRPKQPLQEWADGTMKEIPEASHDRSARMRYVMIGSTKQEVLELQGQPTRETDVAWEYGLSRINFRHDRVSGWYENPMNPLRVSR